MLFLQDSYGLESQGEKYQNLGTLGKVGKSLGKLLNILCDSLFLQGYKSRPSTFYCLVSNHHFHFHIITLYQICVLCQVYHQVEFCV